jgi:hypothetical protein
MSTATLSDISYTRLVDRAHLKPVISLSLLQQRRKVGPSAQFLSAVIKIQSLEAKRRRAF